MRSYQFRVRVLAFVMACAITAPVGAADAFTLLAVPQSPASYMLQGFPVHQQWWGLSCEYAATSAATLYLGKYISEMQFLEGIAFDPNPNKGFRGSIYGGWGGTSDYGIYPPPLLTFLLESGFPASYPFQADTTLLRDAVSHNRPVVAWIDGTFGGAPRYYAESDGEQYLLVPYEHAVTVYGYNEAGVYVMDPGVGSSYFLSWPSFMNAWMQLDGMALAVGV